MFSRYEFKKANFRLKGNDKNVSINFDGEIFDKTLKPIIPVLDEEGFPTVTLKGYLGDKVYRVIDLMVVQFKRLHLPDDLLHEIVGFNIDEDKLNLKVKNIGYRFKNAPLELSDHPGFYYIPSATCTAVNREGVLIRVSSGKKTALWKTAPGVKKSKGGYINFVTIGFNGIRKSFGRHRALVLTFFDYPNNVDDLVVNHIDGIPGNDTLDNLELCTRAKNNQHAKENGLRMQQKAITARNVFTGEITTFLSMADCERALNIHWDTLFRRLSKPERFGEVLPCGYQVKYSDNNLEFPEVSDPKAAIEDSKQAIGIEVLNYQTNEITTYFSISSAAKALGLKGSSISWKLNNKSLTPLKGYAFRLQPEDDFPICTPDQIAKSLESQNLLICAHNLIDDSEMIFDSINQAVKWYGTDFNETLRNGNQPIYEDGWRFRFDNDTWNEIEDVEETLYRLKKGVQVYEISTGAILFYQSAKQVADSLKIDAKRVRRLAFSRGREIDNGRRFRLGDNLMEPWPTND